MLPVIYKFLLNTDFSRAMLYVVALGLVVYAALSGWRSACDAAKGASVASMGRPKEPQCLGIWSTTGIGGTFSKL